MSLLISMMPMYLFGNLHCLGMCGPLAVMIGQHRYRNLYFLGRILSFTLAGFFSGALGTIISVILNHYHISALLSLFFGLLILFMGFFTFFGWQYPGSHWLSKRLASINRSLSLLILKDTPWPTFLFGFFTVALPCGQTIIIFSASALSGSIVIGTLNAFIFALLTTPSLWLAMRMTHLLRKIRNYYNQILALSAIMIGTLACCRGLAEWNIIPHLILNPKAPSQYHVIIF